MSGILCRLLRLWYPGGGRRLYYFRIGTHLADQPDFCRTVCRSYGHRSGRNAGRDGGHAAGDQRPVYAHVHCAFPESGQRFPGNLAVDTPALGSRTRSLRRLFQSEGPVTKGYIWRPDVSCRSSDGLPVHSAGLFWETFCRKILTNALGVALYGMFIAVVVPKSAKINGYAPWCFWRWPSAFFLNMCRCLPVFPAVLPLLSVAVIASVAGALFFPVEEAE